MWERVDYLFIDEVSMISCKFLCRISEALTIAKCNMTTFGGINVIFAGDFMQLPPIRETHHINTQYQQAMSHHQQTVFGKLLWLTVDTMIMLHCVERQAGPENKEFLDLLMCLQEGRCTKSDYYLLNSHVLKPHINIDFTTEPWRHTPIIVYDNATKDALNTQATIAFVKETG